MRNVTLDMTATGGEVGFHFAVGYQRDILGHNDFVDIAKRDDKQRLKKGQTFSLAQDIDSNDFLLDFSEWVDLNNDPAGVNVTLAVDGVIEFSGTGSASNIKDWTRTTFTDHAKQKDDREIYVKF